MMKPQGNLFSKFRLRSFLGLSLLGGATFSLLGCSVSQKDSTEADLKDPRRDGSDPVWVYGGQLPHLTETRIVLSVRGHTIRVSGFAPPDFKETLPEHAISDVINGRQRITVVYPIATVDSRFTTDAGVQASNAAPKEYKNVAVFPYNPFGVGGEKNKSTPWGGFPYIEYERGRNIAFHGPITRSSGLWRLIRGPVSHACNRMQGEHVVELAHLLGVNMNRKWTVDDLVPVRTVVEVLPHKSYDKVPDGQFAGKFVDVDYTPDNKDISISRSSPATSHLFKTWSGLEHPNWICTAEKAKLGSPNPCGTPAPTPEPVHPPAAHKANAKICNIESKNGFANVFNRTLTQVIGKTVLGEPIEVTSEVLVRDNDGNEWAKVWFFDNPIEKLPAGYGYVMTKIICRD